MRLTRELLAAVVAAGLVSQVGAQAGSDLLVRPSGPAETVFDWSHDACEKTHVPDAPARAWRTASGTVSLLMSHNVNRTLKGSSLDTLRQDCTVIFEASRSPRLEAFDDLIWISGVHTRDGKTVHALAHTEQRGERTPGQCPAGKYSPCLLNAVTGLVSEDGGRSFRPQENGGKPSVVMTLPYPYPTDRQRRVGYANPTNVIERDGWLYALVWADRYRAQERGNCLIRTRTPEDPSSWRAWNGEGFTVAFTDPFRDNVRAPEAHVCRPVSPNVLNSIVGGIVRHGAEVVAVFGQRRRMPDGRVLEGIFSSTSRDLVSWSSPELVLEGRMMWDRSCNKTESIFYPSLIDPEAKTHSFEDFGNDGYLYLVRYQIHDCKVTWDRDLVRIPVSIRPGF